MSVQVCVCLRGIERGREERRERGGGREGGGEQREREGDGWRRTERKRELGIICGNISLTHKVSSQVNYCIPTPIDHSDQWREGSLLHSNIR